MRRHCVSRHVCGLAKAGFSLVEVSICVLIVAVVLVAALTALGGSGVGMQRITDRGRGKLLAQMLMSEILQQDYREPDGTPAFGPESSEGLAGSRIFFDDVDDYNGWSAQPPQDKDGTPLAELANWRRSAAVAWVDPADLTQVSGSDTGLKRITVTVSNNDVVAASLVAVRTYAWDEQGVD